MLFNYRRFEVIEMYEDGIGKVVVLKGKKGDVGYQIGMYMCKSKRYEMVGRNRMIAWM